MSCETIEPELIGYHFGTLEPALRTRVEAHLAGCPACVQSFIAVKRDIELGEAEPAPSQASRHRLRRAVMAELGLTRADRPWRWWERPFAFGLAGAALVVAMLTVQAISVGPVGPPRTLTEQGAAQHR